MHEKHAEIGHYKALSPLQFSTIFSLNLPVSDMMPGRGITLSQKASFSRKICRDDYG